MYFCISPPAVRIYDISGSFVLRSGVGTQMMITSQSLKLAKIGCCRQFAFVNALFYVFACYIDDV